MKTLTKLSSLAALAVLLALPAFAQTTPAANPCDEAARTDLYTQYYNQKKTDQKAAFETGKQYLDKYGSCDDQYTASVKKFVDAYSAALGKVTLRFDFFKAFDAKDVRKVNDLAKQLLANDPNDVKVTALAASLGYAGVIPKGSVANDPAVTADVINFAKKTISLIEAGKQATGVDGTTVDWKPFASREDALGWMHYYLGGLQLKTDPAEAAKQMVQVAQSSSSAKEEPSTYSILAAAYEKEREPMVEQYKTLTKNYTVETPESQLLLANINQVVDRIIDAYARAVAYSKADNPGRADWTRLLTELYKSRHDNTDAGLNEYLASVKTTPLLMTQPLTTLPTPAATPTGDGTTPATDSSAAPAATTAPSAPMTQPKPAATQPKPAAAAQPQKPASSPAKKKP